MSQTSTFKAEGVLFDMDGTLTDSIAAVEAAWSRVADDLNLDAETVIAATHGKRAIDNLKDLKPWLESHQMDAEVNKFERSILAFADGTLRQTKTRRSSSIASGYSASSAGSSAASSVASSRRSSFGDSFGLQKLRMTSGTPPPVAVVTEEIEEEIDEAWELEEKMVDRSVRILPGVKDMIKSLPTDKYAVATSGAKTYCYGCLTRTDITIPKVCVTADDPRLKRGKPFPDPFLLAADDLGIDCKKTVVFEDSPSGIKAAVASGATVIAVCTSHEREKIEGLGAHYIVEDMSCVKCHEVDGKLEFEVKH